MDSFETKDQVFDLLNKTFHYFDIPNVFSANKKMEQLFDEQGDRKEMVLDYKNMDKSYSDLSYRIKENLMLVMTMTLETFQRYYPQFSNVFNKNTFLNFQYGYIEGTTTQVKHSYYFVFRLVHAIS